MTYEAALEYFASLEPRGWRLGLDRMAAFCAAAGLDDALGAGEASPKYVHIAGTNGKGSTTAYAQSLLVEAGFRTGAFFSPYVVDPRERWQFGRSMIAPQELADLTEELIPIADRFTDSEFGGITEFEFKTGIDFAYAKRKACQWVALEVGLGGRFDATNVVTPRVSAIVSIGLDHVNILGHTLEEIAMEKAGIIKPGIPAVVGDMPREAFEVISAIADERGSPLWRWGVDFGTERFGIWTPSARYPNLRAGIPGAKSFHNLAVAVAAMEAAGIPLSHQNVVDGAARAFAVGRFQRLRVGGTEMLFDGAHNAEAAQVLRESLADALPGRPVVLVTNMIRGHDPEGFYRALAGQTERAFVVPIDFHRAYPPEETAEVLARAGICASISSDLRSGLDAARNAAGDHATVVVTGSFYLVGEALRTVGRLWPNLVSGHAD